MTLLLALSTGGFCMCLMNMSFNLHIQVAARERMHFRKLLLTMRWNWRTSPSQRQWGILVGFRLNLHLLLFPFWAEDTKYPKEIKRLVPKDSNTKPISPAKSLVFCSKCITQVISFSQCLHKCSNTKNSYNIILFAKSIWVCKNKILSQLLKQILFT